MSDSGAGTARATDAKPFASRLTPEAEARLQATPVAERFAPLGGFAMVPHLLNSIHRKVSGHVQAILVQEIIHATFGAVGNPEWALISFARLETKSRYTRKAYQLALEDAVARGLVRRQRKGKHWTAKVVPEDWTKTLDYTWLPNPAGTPTARDAKGRFCLGSTPLPILDELLAGVDPKTAAMVAVIETSMPVAITLEVAESGVVSVVARDASEPAKSPKVRLDFTTVRPLFAFREVLDPIFLDLFRKIPDDFLLAQIAELCDGAPPSWLVDRIAEKVAAGSYKHSGLVLDLARDVGAAWRAEAAARAAHEALFAAACPACHGTGRDPILVQDDCPACHGTGKRPAEQ